MGRFTFIQNLFRTVLPTLIALVGLAVVVAWLGGAFEAKIPPRESRPPVRVLKAGEAGRVDQVHEVTKEYHHEAVGTLRAASRTEIAARILAPISEIRVKAGGTVSAGDVLIQLDSREFQSKLNQARGALDAAQAAVGQAEKDFNRDAELFKERAVSRSQFEKSSTNVDLAKARFDQASDAVKEAEVALSYTTILAPQSGTIVDRKAEPGDIAQPGRPLLSLYDPASLRLEVPVMENLALALSLGDVLKVHVDALSEDVEARVDEIVPQAEASSRSFLVKVNLARSERMFEGMFGRLLIPVGTRRHICLATAAIRTVGQLDFVEVVDLKRRTKERRLITTGKLGMPGRVEVLSGLDVGDYVLLPTGGDG